MYHLSTRMVSLVLTFGIFFALSCSTFQSSTESPQSLYEAGSYENALQSVNDQIRDNPEDLDLQLMKASILQKIAVENYQPENRTSVYTNLKNTTDEISFKTDTYQARTDSIVTYNLMATTYYRHGDLSEAISTLESIEETGYTRPPETCEKLAYLYLEAGRIDQSIEIYETLSANYPDTEIYQQGLVNSYILGDMHTDVIALLEDLTGVYRNRVQYREALATERFYLLQRQVSNDIESAGSEALSDSEIDQIIDQLNEISSMYRDIDETLPSSEERQQRIAAFFVSSADLLEEIRPVSDESIETRLSDQRETFLRASIPYWQTLYEANSDRSAYAYSLIEVYNELGMEDEAELLQQQVNF